MSRLTFARLLLLLPSAAMALNNGVGLTPAMGYNTYQSPWSFQGGDALVIADALNVTGLQAVGYRYVNSDAGWQSNKGGRNASGSPVPSMATTAAALQARGFMMGLYSALSSVQCGMAPGGLYHEDLDAQAYAEWGLDYLKYDNCAEYALEPNARSSPMRDALNRSGRRVLFSTEPFHLSPNPQAHIANLWRTTTDVADTTTKVRVNLDLNDKWAEFAGPGAFNDPDMLQVGKGKATTVNEHRSNFLLWAVAKAPLLLSTNLTALAQDFPVLLELLRNEEVIAINQDPDGVQARKLMVDGVRLGKPVGVEQCATPDLMALSAAACSGGGGCAAFRSFAEVAAAKQRWELVPAPGGSPDGAVQLRHGLYAGRCLALQPPNPIAYNPPYRHPTRPNPRPVWSAAWQAVLQPCDQDSAMQRWRFAAPGQYPAEEARGFARSTLSALLNDAATNASHAPPGPGPFGNASNGTVALSVLPETDSRYGVNHVGGAGLEYPDVEVACTTRGCTQYQPSQMWYLDAVTGQLQSGNYTASINEQWLTAMVPAPARRCLAAVASADMAGTLAGTTEVWGGPLAGGKLVVALSNRSPSSQATVAAPVSALFEPHGFFSFAMLASPGAEAAGYAESVPPPAAAAESYTVRDVLARTTLPETVSAATGVVSAKVDPGDTRLFVLSPAA